MSLLDRFADWLETHEHIETRVAVVFLAMAFIYVAGHVAVFVF